VPERAEWITAPSSYSKNPLPKDLLKPDDVERLIDAAYNPRDEALVALLWETGARIGEIIGLTVGV